MDHLEEAIKRDALILYFGDLFDAMQGRFDPRRSMMGLRPEYRRDDYYDFVVTDVAEYLAPVADRILLLGRGNHETSVLKNANTDLIDRLAYRLNVEHGTNIKTGGFGGWVRLLILLNGKNHGTVNLKYFHGSGGEAPVTRGVIQTNRQAVYLPDADVVVNGHSHNAYYVPINRERISNKGIQYFDIQHHIRIPGYHMDYADGSAGWIVERGGPPKPNGVFWIRVSTDSKTGSPKLRIEPDITGGIPLTPVRGEEPDWPGYTQDSEYP